MSLKAKGKLRAPINRRESTTSDVDDVSDTDSLSMLRVPVQGFEPDESAAFKTVATPPAIIITLLIMIAYEVALFLDLDFSFYIIEEDARFLFMSLLHIFVFLDVFVATKIIQYYHTRARNHGHLEFNRSTKSIRKAPFLTLSFGMAAHVALFCLWAPTESYAGFERINLLQGLFSFELLVSMSIFLVLLIKTIRFNMARPPPDSIESLMPKYDGGRSTSISSAPETGFNEEEQIDDVVLRQGDMIQYLKHQKTALSEKILELTEKLRKIEEGANTTVQSEVVQIQTAPQNDINYRDEVIEKGRQIHQLQEELDATKLQLEKTLLEKSNFQKESEHNMLLFQKEKIARELYIEETEKAIEELRKRVK